MRDLSDGFNADDSHIPLEDTALSDTLAQWSTSEEHEREINARALELIESYEAELSVLGEIFSSSSQPKETATDEDAAIMQARLEGQAARNEVLLVLIAYSKVNHERGSGLTVDEQTSAKRQLQATLFADGHSEHWLQLVDRELPGKGYADSDIAEFLEAANRERVQLEEWSSEYASQIDKITGLLCFTDEELASSDFPIMFGAACRLATFKKEFDEAKVIGDIAKAGSIAEDQKLWLMEQGLFHTKWVDVFSQLFS